MAKDFTKKMYKTVNELIDSTKKTDKNEPLLKIVEYVKQFRKMREGLKNG